MTTFTKSWWKEEVIYQIYPRSFKDSNSDGIGDLRGIISKLDYLKDLGVDIIWLSPIYDSPNDDNGYDISDYYNIHPEFGTMDDFDELLSLIHAKGMKLIMDVVLNHSSDEHQWFQESRKSKDNPYRDYYFWKQGKNGLPPNNWKSFFGGSTWEYDAVTDEYYLHIFSKKQPDLNWENPKVRESIYEIVRFWLDKGIDGFRMDVIPLISKRLEFADSPHEMMMDTIEKVYSNGPKVHQYINEMYEKVLKDYDIMTVGEGPGISKEIGLDYVGHDRDELNMIFHLDHMFLGHGTNGRFDPLPYTWQDIKTLFVEWDTAMGASGWISIFLDNHDFPRLVSRFGDDKNYRIESAKALAILVLTLRGTPCIYQGSEIGMTNVVFDKLEDYKDIETVNHYDEFVTNGIITHEEYKRRVSEFGRDNARTPMQWNGDKHAGFTTGSPWISANPNYSEINVTKDLCSRDSIYAFYKELLSYRKNNKVLIYGSFEPLNDLAADVFVYKRTYGDESKLVMINHSSEHQSVDLGMNIGILELQNIENGMSEVLLPWEARIYKLYR